MKIAFIGTYPPRQCGIGTFTYNLINAISCNTDSNNLSALTSVIAINENGSQYQYPDEVKYTIRQNQQVDYINAADFINFSDAEVCVLQHEFGIYGGQSGIFILPLIHRLEIPLVVTFHTILREPTFEEKSITRIITQKAAKIVVMTKKALHFLVEIYGVPSEKIQIIEHGVPDIEMPGIRQIRKKLDLDQGKMIFTFGLLSRNKGIETVINALPKVIEKYPKLTYVVLGNTHPQVLKHAGEEYRNYLIRLAKDNGVDKQVVFKKAFVSEQTLYEYLMACDIYITPYLNEAQITSGTLSYAIGAGAAVVSTPYWHAQELLDEGRGRFFDFKNPEALANTLLELLDNKEVLDEMKEKAREYGSHLKWPLAGKQYLDILEDVKEKLDAAPVKEKLLIDSKLMPDLKLDHLRRLTDDTGIVQHAKYGIPNLKEGYCLDDNSRALMATLMAFWRNRDEETIRLMPIYLSYIHYMQNIKGTFRNFLSFDRRFLDEEGSEDAFGRTIWSLGYIIKRAPNDAYFQIAREIFITASENFMKLTSIRGTANTIIGLSYYLQKFQTEEAFIDLLVKMTDKLTNQYLKNRTEDWQWFEDVLTYDNGILPLALFHSAEITGDKKVIKIAVEATSFLDNISFRKGHLTPVGNQGWYEKGKHCPDFDQQAIDVMAMVLLYFRAYIVTKKRKYIERMFNSYMWFLGENDLRMPLYDYETQGCCDGLQFDGINRNQGAESTLAYLISQLTVLSALDIEHEFESS